MSEVSGKAARVSLFFIVGYIPQAQLKQEINSGKKSLAKKESQTDISTLFKTDKAFGGCILSALVTFPSL